MNKLKKLSARQQEQNLIKKLNGGMRAFDHAEGDMPIAPIVTGNQLMQMGAGKYNPPFKAQIQVSVLKYYFTQAAAGGAWTNKAAAAIPATLQLKLPFFLFANSDFESGYAKLRAQYPQSVWAYQRPVIYGKDQAGTDQNAFGRWDSTVTNLLRAGDLVLPFTAVTADVGAENNLALVVIRTADVPYATLLTATNSNTFKINLIRYTVNVGQEAQFANAILVTDETMFGKFSSDPINPEASKNPEQNQDNILDLDVKVDINKQKGLASEAEYDVVSMRLNLFIAEATKIV